MRVSNKTDYDTKTIRELTRRVAKEELDVKHKKGLRVDFLLAYKGRTKNGGLGLCFPGRRYVQIILPKNEKLLDIEKIAKVLAHEFAHVRGMNHKEMKGNPRYDWVWGEGGWRDWVEKMGYTDGLELKKVVEKKVKPSKDLKLQHAKTKVLEWKKKKSRAETGLKTWSRKVKYYEGRIAADRKELGK